MLKLSQLTGNILVSATDKGLTKVLKQKEHLRQENSCKKCCKKKYLLVLFDRNGFLYHGRVKSLCEGMRE
jgi:ribosomal protein L18